MNQEPFGIPISPVPVSGTASAASELSAEETLRQLARLEPPAGVAERVHRRLLEAELASERKEFWSLRMPVRRLQYAGAAVLAVAMGATGWGVYHSRQVATNQTAQPGKPILPVTAPVDAAREFRTAGAEGRPHTLTPIKVPAVPKKKPSAGKGKIASKAERVADGRVVQGSTGQASTTEPKP